MNPQELRKMELRQKCQDGTITLDEMREVILLLRSDRSAAAVKPTKAKPILPSGSDLLNELLS